MKSHVILGRRVTLRAFLFRAFSLTNATFLPTPTFYFSTPFSLTSFHSAFSLHHSVSTTRQRYVNSIFSLSSHHHGHDRLRSGWR